MSDKNKKRGRSDERRDFPTKVAREAGQGQPVSDRHRQEHREPQNKYSRSDDEEDDESGSDDQSDDDGDKVGLIDIRPGEYIRDRFKVLGVAGQGTFGTVLDVFDEKYKDRIALKVVRSVKRYLKAARVEMEILSKLRKADPEHDSHCVRIYSFFEFEHRGQKHVGIGFEKLGKSLYDFIRKNDHRGFPLENVRSYAYQLLKALAFCHKLKLIHTDLKPENILLCNSEYKTEERDGRKYRYPVDNSIRLIDFGGATYDYDHHSRIINTRQYRAPEVLLGMGWSYPSDLWCVGCILPELFTGNLLFKTHEDLEHLALMEHVLGQTLPKEMAQLALDPYQAKAKFISERKMKIWDGKTASNRPDSREISPTKRNRGRSSSCPRPDKLLHFSDGKLRWPAGAQNLESVNHVEKAKTLEKILPDPLFCDLIKKLLQFDPAKRLTADEALQHDFLKEERERDERERRRKKAEKDRESLSPKSPVKSYES